MKYIMGAFISLAAIAAAYVAYSDYCYYKSESNK